VETARLQPAWPLRPVAAVGQTVMAMLAYLGSTALLALEALAYLAWPFGRSHALEGSLGRVLVHSLAWMMALGIPIVGLVHVALGSFLSLQAYYGSTFVDGAGAVVGVGLLRNLGGIMTGFWFAVVLAVRLIPEVRLLAQENRASHAPLGAGALVAPRLAAAAAACVLLSLWGVAVGTTVGWRSSDRMMGISTESFFLMMSRMLWFRDIVGLVIKGVCFGAVAALICCHEGLADQTASESGASHAPGGFVVVPAAAASLRALCLAVAAVLVISSSWFILVYHAVPFYGPTLLPAPGP